VKGEDLDKLQKEAFDSLGLKNPPATHMAAVRRGMYAADQEKQILALKPGEFTSVMELPSAFVIFKLESRQTLTAEKAKDEITRILVKENVEKQEQARAKAVTVDFNDQYLGPPQGSAWIPASKMNAPADKAHAGGEAKNAPAAQQTPK